MKVLFDANVVLDVLLQRPGFAASALAVAKVDEPWITTLTLANICYIVGRTRRDRIAAPLAYLRSKFRLAAISATTVERAVSLDFADFEDALQLAASEENAVGSVVTHNGGDFRSTPLVTVMSVEELLAALR